MFIYIALALQLPKALKNKIKFNIAPNNSCILEKKGSKAEKSGI